MSDWDSFEDDQGDEWFIDPETGELVSFDDYQGGDADVWEDSEMDFWDAVAELNDSYA